MNKITIKDSILSYIDFLMAIEHDKKTYLYKKSMKHSLLFTTNIKQI